MYQRITITPCDVAEFSKSDIVGLYVEAVKSASRYDEFDKLEVFKSLYPEEYKRFSKISRLRGEIRKTIESMEALSESIYWGTLTFKDEKNKNTIKTKREEAFEKLNSVFKFVLLVEEYGETNGRYHIHFISSFKEGKDFNDFKRCWHSRQQLQVLSSEDKIDKYLIKYLSKDIPRIRRNKNLSGLVARYKAHQNTLTYQHRYSTKKVETFEEFAHYALKCR